MDIMSYVEQGGVIMYVLIFLNIIGFTTIIIKISQFFYVRLKLDSIVKDTNEKFNKKDSSIQLLLIEQIIKEKVVKLEAGLSTIKTIATISPLLGLLGTVIGVLMAFEKISKYGLNDPNIFAQGISLALITTVGGLVVAIPHYIAYNYLINILIKIETKLYKKSTISVYKD